MRKFIATKLLNRFENQYGYDVSYMRHMLDVSPGAFFKFSKIMSLSSHCEAAPRDAVFTAKLVGAIAEDCGPCVQLVVDMARDAGMDVAQIEAVLKRTPHNMNEQTAMGFRFADAVLKRSPDEDDVRDAVRVQWGEAAVIDLTLGLQIGRMFPMIKTGMGFAKTCQRVRVGDDAVDVTRQAA